MRQDDISILTLQKIGYTWKIQQSTVVSSNCYIKYKRELKKIRLTYFSSSLFLVVKIVISC